MAFGKGFRAKMDKMFSSSKDPEIVDDPPPPYVLPEEFTKIGIKEDDLEILKHYDTVIVLDDSGSMEPLWNQVSPTPPGRSTADSQRVLLKACRALSTLATVASRYDKDGIDIRFLNNTRGEDHFKVKRFIVRLYHFRVNGLY